MPINIKSNMQINPNLKVTYLRCEYKVDPLGIDIVKPRLSWIIESNSNKEFSQRQTAYRIIVSSSKENLVNNIPDFWDSSKIISDQQNQIEYAGKELRSKDECWWKVKIWDKNNIETEWSEPAKWTIGLLNRNDWKAKWIGFDEFEREDQKKEKFEFKAGEDKWIWYPLNKTEYGKGIGNYFFRKKIFIKNIDEINSAKVLITADEKFIIYLNGKLIDKSDDKIFSWTRPKIVEVKSSLSNNQNVITVEGINTYLEKPGLAAKLLIIYRDGSEEIIATNFSWKTSNIKTDDWNENNFDDTKWISAEVTAKMGDKPWRVPKVNLFLPPPPYLRKEFNSQKKIKKAVVTVSALGLYKLFINGKNISDDRLTPGWADYNKRVYYNSYDVKKILKSTDKNCIGIILADGWYAGYVGWEKHREYYGKNPRVILQLEIEYADGTNEIICSDESCKASYGPITEADILMGETYNAKKELTGWANNDYDDSKWKNVDVSENINVEMNSYPGIPIRKTLEIKPDKIIPNKNGIYIFDLGQNIAGSVRLKINGKKSKKIILRFGEMIDEDGNLYTENIRMARAADTYLTKGETEEIWQPDFTYHGFRYIEVSGYSEQPDLEMITGIVFHSDLFITGSFECSDKMLNKLYENILWSQRANFMDIPTDCPQRDERLGWTADAVDFIRTASYNFNTHLFYSKWLQDLNDVQEKNGAYTAIAPQPDLGVGPLYPGAAGWADAGIVTPYELYKFFDDKKNLQVYYNNMLKYMNYLEINADNFLMPEYGYGDWLSVNAETPKDLIATAYFAYDAKLMIEISSVLGKINEQKKFEILFQQIKNAFNKKYINNDGSINNGTQTAYILSLYFALLNKEKEKEAFNFLIDDIKRRDWHLSTGFIGLTYLFPVLTIFGRSDIAYKILLNETFPSWGFMINNGATTLWERWDSWTPDKGFFDPLMNSFNHTSLGVIGEWFYSGIGGIIPAEPGFKKITIKPEIGGNLSYANTSYNSIYGMIKSDWKISENNFYLNVTIPINTTAEIIILKLINNRAVVDVKADVKLKSEVTESTIKYFTGSGEYNFSALLINIKD